MKMERGRRSAVNESFEEKEEEEEETDQARRRKCVRTPGNKKNARRPQYKILKEKSARVLAVSVLIEEPISVWLRSDPIPVM